MMSTRMKECAKDILSLSDVTRLLTPLASKWHELGVHLKLEKSTLNTIQANHIQSGGVERCLSEVVTFWQQNESDPSWEKLANAVEGVESYADIVRKIREECTTDDEESGYGSSAQSTDSEPDVFDTSSLSPGCGCGECNVHKMCTVGCPTPDHTKRIPILTKYKGGETASEVASKRSRYGHRSTDDFEEETESICEHFGSLVVDTCESLKKRESKKRVALYLKRSFRILKKVSDEMNRSEDMEDLFDAFTEQACSWFNFNILKKLIEKFGDPNDCKRLADYEEHFAKFAKQRLPRGMTHVELGSKSRMAGCKQLVVKVDREWESISIAELERLCKEFARILGIERKDLYLADVNEGCIMLTLMVPQEIATSLSKERLTKAQKESLTKESVVRFSCGKLRWLRTSPSIDLDPPTEESNEGGYNCEFVDHPPNYLQVECPFCLQIVRDPQLVSCCGYSFCSHCLQRIQTANQPCPTCNTQGFTVVANKGLQCMLHSFNVRCSNVKDGCKWTGELGDLEKHLNTNPQPDEQLEGCVFTKVRCTHCNEEFKRSEVDKHQSEKCRKRPFKCEHCKTYETYYDDVVTNPWPECGSKPVPCPNKCGKSPLRRNLDNHVANDCPLTPIDCEFPVCNTQGFTVVANKGLQRMRSSATSGGVTSCLKPAELHYRDKPHKSKQKESLTAKKSLYNRSAMFGAVFVIGAIIFAAMVSGVVLRGLRNHNAAVAISDANRLQQCLRNESQHAVYRIRLPNYNSNTSLASFRECRSLMEYSNYGFVQFGMKFTEWENNIIYTRSPNEANRLQQCPRKCQHAVPRIRFPRDEYILEFTSVSFLSDELILIQSPGTNLYVINITLYVQTITEDGAYLLPRSEAYCPWILAPTFELHCVSSSRLTLPRMNIMLEQNRIDEDVDVFKLEWWIHEHAPIIEIHCTPQARCLRTAHAIAHPSHNFSASLILN